MVKRKIWWDILWKCKTGKGWKEVCREDTGEERMNEFKDDGWEKNILEWEGMVKNSEKQPDEKSSLLMV